MNGAVRVENLEFAYGPRKVLQGVSFAISQGESVGLAGPNGAGKSTLLWCLMGLLKPAAGRVEIRGRPGAVFQNPEDQLFMPSILLDVTADCRGRKRASARWRRWLRRAWKKLRKGPRTN
jgi:energy-coupling factor transporter ATP-binding protein EcfA2